MDEISFFIIDRFFVWVILCLHVVGYLLFYFILFLPRFFFDFPPFFFDACSMLLCSCSGASRTISALACCFTCRYFTRARAFRLHARIFTYVYIRMRCSRACVHIRLFANTSVYAYILTLSLLGTLARLSLTRGVSLLYAGTRVYALYRRVFCCCALILCVRVRTRSRIRTRSRTHTPPYARSVVFCID